MKRSLVIASVSILAVAAVATGIHAWSSRRSDAGDSVDIPTFDSVVERGEWVFERHECGACHGEAGSGGVENENYVLGTISALDHVADRLLLFSPDEAEAVLALLEEGVDPEARRDDPPFDGYDRFLAKYELMSDVIDDGATAGKADPAGPEPPLQMPAWRGTLSDEDKRAVLAYLISLYDWEGEAAVVDEVDEVDDPYADDGDDPYADDGDDPYADDGDDPYAE